jgi:hypothetical protein
MWLYDFERKIMFTKSLPSDPAAPAKEQHRRVDIGRTTP